jgi:2-phospho-L-lactate transferase/gluconeogenesis factor (CofD/UPF0052 family)
VQPGAQDGSIQSIREYLIKDQVSTVIKVSMVTTMNGILDVLSYEDLVTKFAL